MTIGLLLHKYCVVVCLILRNRQINLLKEKGLLSKAFLQFVLLFSKLQRTSERTSETTSATDASTTLTSRTDESTITTSAVAVVV